MLTHLAATYIAREAGRDTLITPTRAELSKNHKDATVYVSVFPDTEGAHALEFLNRHADSFREYLKKEARFSHVPRVTFAIDEGELARQHLDDLSRGL